jgi:drug/metabolite transporter (DMT)-like permease
MGAIGWALISAAFCALGIVLQQKGAMEAPPASTGGFIGSILSKPVWLAGLGGQVLGFATEALALDKGALFVVQPIISLQVVLALPLGIWITHQRVGGREWLGAVAVLVGLGFFLGVSHPASGRDTVPTAVWIAATVGVAVLVAAVVVIGWHRPPGEKAALFGAAAGILFGFQAAAMKAFDTVVPGGISAMVTSWSSYALLFSALGGFYLMQTSLQVGALAPSIASTNAANPATTTALGRWMYLETPARTAGGKVVSVVSLALAFVGLIWLARGQAAAPSEAPQPLPRPS